MSERMIWLSYDVFASAIWIFFFKLRSNLMMLFQKHVICTYLDVNGFFLYHFLIFFCLSLFWYGCTFAFGKGIALFEIKKLFSDLVMSLCFVIGICNFIQIITTVSSLYNVIHPFVKFGSCDTIPYLSRSII